jgi:hypothetical protein
MVVSKVENQMEGSDFVQPDVLLTVHEKYNKKK